LAKMRAGRKNNRQQIVNQLWSFCIDVVKKLCRSDEHLSSQKKSHGLDEMLLSALRQALNVSRHVAGTISQYRFFNRCCTLVHQRADKANFY